MEQMCLPAFQAAAAAAATVELKLRLLCDLRPETADLALANLDLVRKEVVRAFGSLLSDDEQEQLKACVSLRNRIIHQQLSKASGKLVSLGEELNEAGVWSLDLETGVATETASTSTKTGKIYGWMLVSHAQGAFAAALRVFDQGIAVINRALANAPSAVIPPR